MLLKSGKTFYDDPENVHNTYTNDSISNSYKNIVEYLTDSKIGIIEKELIIDFLIEKNFKEISILLQLIDENQIFCKINENFENIFRVVFSRVITHPDFSEIIKIIEKELYTHRNSSNACFIGYIKLLINSLSGFCEEIDIIVPLSGIISAKIISKIVNTNKTSSEIKEEITTELFEYKYISTIQQLESWINMIDDETVEDIRNNRKNNSTNTNKLNIKDEEENEDDEEDDDEDEDDEDDEDEEEDNEEEVNNDVNKENVNKEDENKNEVENDDVNKEDDNNNKE